ncbi:MAG: 4Fe-4S ferredoxin [Eubacteriales bacterium]|nr:4Fe-4S ferredoxin [Eubacteriales bacterium]
MVDYTLCTECGSCISKCTHGVFNASKAPVPVIRKPEACIDHCHGCGNRCPAGAITYLGEDTGWVPPHGLHTVDDSDCRCDCADAVKGVGNVSVCARGESNSGENIVAIDNL